MSRLYRDLALEVGGRLGPAYELDAKEEAAHLAMLTTERAAKLR